MIIAIPKLNNVVATCFDAARHFEIVLVKNKRVISSKTVKCHGSEDFQRVRFLRLHEIHTLICNGIKGFYLDQLLSIGIIVIPHINDSVQGAITRFLDGELISYDDTQNRIESNNLVSHDELTKWAKNLFEDNGYSVSPCLEHDSYLIDLVAEYQCPVCSKKIDVAICCGAQIYRVDQEILEFHHIAKTRYNARVYVYITNPRIAKSCNEYGINFISPGMTDLQLGGNIKSAIPILQKPVEGHERAYNYQEG